MEVVYTTVAGATRAGVKYVRFDTNVWYSKLGNTLTFVDSEAERANLELEYKDFVKTLLADVPGLL